MKLTIYMDNASSYQNIPDEPSVQQWVDAALTDKKGEAELSIRVVDENESSELNLRYRNKQGPTNVLSFPADLPESLQELLLEESLQLPLLGDLVICAQVVEREAQQQNKSLKAHWAHMLVHGSLHLIGYDHMNDHEAELMEQMETNILTNLDFPPPYEQPPGAIDTK